MLAILFDILLPIGAIRLYKRKNISLIEMVLLCVMTSILIFACTYFSSLTDNIEKILIHFFLLVVSAGSLDFLVKSDQNKEFKRAATRLMYSLFGLLLTIALFKLDGLRRDQTKVKYTWLDLSEVTSLTGGVLFYLSLIYFSIRIFTEVKKLLKKPS